MIDFDKFRYEGMAGFGDAGREMLHARSLSISADLSDIKNNKFNLGCHLIDLYESQLYAAWADGYVMEKIRGESGLSYICGNCCSEVFFAYCQEKFDLDKSQVSRYMNVVDEFGDGERGFKAEWSDYKYSQLVEMLPLTPEERKAITPDMTIAAIRAYKKSLVATSQQNDESEPTETKKSVATSQQDKMEKAFNAAVPIPLGYLEYSHLRQFSVKTLCDLYLDSCNVVNHLQKEVAELREELAAVKAKAADKDIDEKTDVFPDSGEFGGGHGLSCLISGVTE